MSEGTLIEKMIARAKTDPANRDELRQLVCELTEAVEDKTPGKDGLKILLATWARVRRRWCEISGEHIVSPTVSKVAGRLMTLGRRQPA